MSSGGQLSASALARRREIARVWNLLHPKPMELRKGRRRFLREGPLQQWSPVQKRVKKKYVFLFSDCLLITRKDNPHRYWMKIFCFLSSIRDIQAVPGQAYGKVPDVEFRVVTAKKTLIFFASSKTEAETWIRDLNYARGGCKGRAPPSVWQYGDEDNELEGQEEEIDISGEPAHPPGGHQIAHQPAQPAHHAVPQQQPVAQAPAKNPNDDLILIDWTGASTSFNPFGASTPAPQSGGAGFDPFGLGQTAPGGSPGMVDPNTLYAGGFYHGQPGTPGQYGQPGSPGHFAQAGTAPQPEVAHAVQAPAPVFLPDAAQGAAQVASDLCRYLESMPANLQNPSMTLATQKARDASARLQAAIQAFNANPNPETGRLLQQAAAEAAVLVSQLMGEATFVAESQPPDDYKRQLAAAVHLTALSLEQLVNASSLALDHYTQQEHQRQMQAAAAQAEAFARAEAERAQQAALVAQQQEALRLAQEAAEREQSEAARAAVEHHAKLIAEQEAQAAREAIEAQQQASRALQESMASVHNAMESVALSIAAAGEKLAAAAAAAAERAAASSAPVPAKSGEIVQGTSAITSLTAALIRVATEAQAEVTKKLGSTMLASGARYHDDPVWREGLISAAQDVGTNIELLVGAATEATEHNGPLEMLIASLRQVNGACARLVAAARAKMSPDSVLLPKLGEAASNVRTASSTLEQTAAAAGKERDSAVQVAEQPLEKSPSAPAAYIQRMEKLAEVARLEKQLEEARKRVAQITKAQYDHV